MGQMKQLDMFKELENADQQDAWKRVFTRGSKIINQDLAQVEQGIVAQISLATQRRIDREVLNSYYGGVHVGSDNVIRDASVYGVAAVRTASRKGPGLHVTMNLERLQGVTYHRVVYNEEADR